MKKVMIAMAVLALVGLMALPALAGSALDLVNKGAAEVAAGNNDRAIDLLTKAIQAKSLSKKDLARAYNERGKAYEARSFWGNALEDYRLAVWNDRQNKEYQKNNHRMLRRQGSPN